MIMIRNIQNNTSVSIQYSNKSNIIKKYYTVTDDPTKADFAMLYRDEKPGELSGLARVRAFSQDDCHVFCREDQVDIEVDMALSMTKKIMKTFGLSYKYRLSTRDPKHPEKYIGDPKVWEKTEKWAEEIMKRNKIEYFDGPGEAAFYAPKMDLIAKDSLGREWQLSTVQIDYFLPERFNLTYIDSDGLEKRPVMIHRAIVGSPERFLMILIEHFGGAFPTWLAPVQAKLLPILKHGRQIIRPIRVQQIQIVHCARRDNLCDFSLHQFSWLRGRRLLCDRHPFASLDQPRNVTLRRMIRHATHRNAIALRQRDIQNRRRCFGILKEQLIKVSQPEK
jgi:threonyl-tRNA synthetase